MVVSNILRYGSPNRQECKTQQVQFVKRWVNKPTTSNQPHALVSLITWQWDSPIKCIKHPSIQTDVHTSSINHHVFLFWLVSEMIKWESGIQPDHHRAHTYLLQSLITAPEAGYPTWARRDLTGLVWFGQNILMSVWFRQIIAIRHDDCCLIHAGYSHTCKGVTLW